MWQRFAQVRALLTSLELRMTHVVAAVGGYASLTVVNAVLEGVGTLLLVHVFTGGAAAGAAPLPEVIARVITAWRGDLRFPGILVPLIVIFSLSLIIRFGLLAVEGAVSALLRRRIQEAIFKSYLLGDWAHMREFRVGDAVGTTTQEAIIVAKYLTSAISTIYFSLGVAVLGVLALSTSVSISVALGFLGLPLVVLLHRVFRIQARVSKESAGLRNVFSADIADRLNGLLQIHVDANYRFHLDEGLRTQPRLTRLDMVVGVCQAVIGSSSVLLPLMALAALFAWTYLLGGLEGGSLSLVASVGVLGVRAANQFMGAVSAFGNLSRLSGSLYPVVAALSIPAAPDRREVAEPVVRVVLSDVSYAFGTRVVIDRASLLAERNAPLVLSGRSGQGKTTLANLMAGLYFPTAGTVTYVGASGARYASDTFRARVGFVTQDIYLFRGSLRTNLTAGRARTDQEIWAALAEVDADTFVRALGGLDIESAEAGRSLSGGERRRLGIARVLLSGSDILIFDEVTAGLDQENKRAVLDVIARLSAGYIVVVIAHEALSLPNQTGYHL